MQSGKLRIIESDPPIPPIRYFAVHRTQDLSPIGERMAKIAKECCDFSLRTLPGRAG